MKAFVKKMAAKFLEDHSELLGRNGCNDLYSSKEEEDRFWADLSLEERRQFIKEYHEWNGDPENFDPDFLHIPDFALAGFLAQKIKQNE